MWQELERHMANSHSNEQVLVEIVPDSNVETNDEVAEDLIIDDEEEAEAVVIKVVMVKRKVLWWPAEVIEEKEVEDEIHSEASHLDQDQDYSH